MAELARTVHSELGHDVLDVVLHAVRCDPSSARDLGTAHAVSEGVKDGPLSGRQDVGMSRPTSPSLRHDERLVSGAGNYPPPTEDSLPTSLRSGRSSSGRWLRARGCRAVQLTTGGLTRGGWWIRGGRDGWENDRRAPASSPGLWSLRSGEARREREGAPSAGGPPPTRGRW